MQALRNQFTQTIIVKALVGCVLFLNVHTSIANIPNVDSSVSYDKSKLKLPKPLPAGSYKDVKNLGMKDVGRSAQQWVKSEGINDPSKLPSSQNGTMSMSDGAELNPNEFYPGAAQSNSGLSTDYFPDGTKDADDLKSIYSDANARELAGIETKNALFDDANSDSPSIGGSAYAVMLKSNELAKPSFENDPIMKKSRTIYDTIDDLVGDFKDCEITHEVINAKQTRHVEDIKRCEKKNEYYGDCEIHHTVTVAKREITVYVAGAVRNNITVEFDLSTGTGAVVEPSNINPDRYYHYFDIPALGADFCDVEKPLVNYLKAEHWRGWDSIQGIYDFGGRQLDTSVGGGVIEQPTCENGLKGKVNITDYGGSRSDNHYVLSRKWVFELVTIDDEEWYPQSCIDDAIVISEGMCTGTLTVTNGRNTDGCLVIDSESICEDDPILESMMEPPAPGLHQLDRTISVSEIDCGWNSGTGECFTDAHGDYQCPQVNGEAFDTCGLLENDPSCAFISSECLDDAFESGAGNCYLTQYTYDCGYEFDADVPIGVPQTSCDSEIQCMGTDCIDPDLTQSQDFAKVAALLNVVQFISQDMSCSGVDGNGQPIPGEVQECEVFTGEALECKTAIGSWQNCCFEPTQISMGDYLQLLLAVPQMHAALAATSTTYAAAFEAGKTAVTNALQSIGGEVAKFFEPVTNVVNNVVTKIQEKIAEMTAKLVSETTATTTTAGASGAGTGASHVGTEQVTTEVGKEAGKQAGEEAGKQAMSSFINGAMQAVTIVGYVYTAYVVANLMVQLAYPCEEEEFTLQVRRGQEACEYVDDYCPGGELFGECPTEYKKVYCCFSSPLSKIINREVKAQLKTTSRPFGTDPENPDCGGIPLEDIMRVDWDRIDLSEWEDILLEHGKFSDPSNLNMEFITGKGHELNFEDPPIRDNAEKRTRASMESVDLEEAYEKSKQMRIDPGG